MYETAADLAAPRQGAASTSGRPACRAVPSHPSAATRGATHLPGEELAVTVHGRATIIDIVSAEQAGFRETLLSIYLPRYGAEWETFLDSGSVYARMQNTVTFSRRASAPR